jgi:Rod binding domain-containing protein
MNSITNAVSATLPLAASPQLQQAVNQQLDSKQHAAEVGKEFESLFLSLMLKELRSSLQDGMFQGDGGDVYGGLFDLMMGQSLATSNPLGIGQMIQNYLPAESTAESGSKLNAQL